MRNLTSETNANAELSDALVKSLHKEQCQFQKAAILLRKVNSLKSLSEKLSPARTAYLLDTSSLNTEVLVALENGAAIPEFFKERANPTKFDAFKKLFQANAKASSAIDFLQSKYAADINLTKNSMVTKSTQFESQNVFLYNLSSEKELALDAISILDSKYLTTFQDSKYYE